MSDTSFNPIAWLAVKGIRLYQILISPLLPRGICRFTPSCSQYTIEAIRKYGFWRGGLKGAWRICRCNPWGGSGEDLP